MNSKATKPAPTPTRNWLSHDGADHLFESGRSFRVRAEDSGGCYHSVVAYLELLTINGWQELEERSGGTDWGGGIHTEKTVNELKVYAEFLLDNKAPISAPAQPSE